MGEQVGDQGAFGAEGEAVGGVLDVAAGEGAAVVHEGGGAYGVAGIRGVGRDIASRACARSAVQSTGTSEVIKFSFVVSSRLTGRKPDSCGAGPW